MQLELTSAPETLLMPPREFLAVRAAEVSSGARSNVAVSFSHVRKLFANGRGVVEAISDLSFDVKRGEYACILGRSGCGKSTTVNLLLGINKPTSGRISIFGIDPIVDFAKLRGHLACIFQSDRLLPWRSAIDNVRLPLEILGLDERKLEVGPLHWLECLGLRGFKHAYPVELSGGMRQRVALARALVSNPDLVIADEAFAHLDEVTSKSLRADFHRLAKESGKTVIHITHSIEEAINLADRIIVFGRPGHVVADIDDIRLAAADNRDELRSRIREHLELGSSIESTERSDQANEQP